MATAEIEHEEHSKRDRILNALAVYPDDTAVSNQAIAELTGASTSYVYQLRTAMDEGELTADEVESAHDEALQRRYRDRLRELVGESDGQRPPEAEGEPHAEETAPTDSAPAEPQDGTVPRDAVEGVRDRLAQYRADAAWERDRFEGAGKDIAEEKYFIANRAVELLDAVIEG